jgi:geranylgeranyl reductase family protein
VRESQTVRGSSDVLVVGGGPAGAAAGIVLARAGVDVCVIDRARFPRDKICGDAVSDGGVRLLEELGARAAVDAASHALVREGAAVFPDGTRIARQYPSPCYIVPRLTLDDCLRRALEESGARLVQGRRVAAIAQTDGRVDGVTGPGLEWSAPLVIAADGHGSVGLPALGVESPKGRLLGVAKTAYLRGVEYPDGDEVSDHYFDEELPYGYGWIFPAVDGVSNVGVYLRADAYQSTGRQLGDLLSEFLVRKRARLGRAEMVGKTRAWPLPIAPRPGPVTGPGLILTGDAGGFIDPLSGEGIWQALRTGMLAGGIAAQAVAQGGLTKALRRTFEDRCRVEIGRASRKKAWVQHAMAVLVAHRLYRLAIVRAALTWGYANRALEMTKS